MVSLDGISFSSGRQFDAYIICNFLRCRLGCGQLRQSGQRRTARGLWRGMWWIRDPFRCKLNFGPKRRRDRRATKHETRRLRHSDPRFFGTNIFKLTETAGLPGRFFLSAFLSIRPTVVQPQPLFGGIADPLFYNRIDLSHIGGNISLMVAGTDQFQRRIDRQPEVRPF